MVKILEAQQGKASGKVEDGNVNKKYLTHFTGTSTKKYAGFFDLYFSVKSAHEKHLLKQNIKPGISIPNLWVSMFSVASVIDKDSLKMLVRIC